MLTKDLMPDRTLDKNEFRSALSKPTIQERLNALRITYGLRNNDVARALETTDSSVSRWLNPGNHLPSLYWLVQLCRLFRVTIDDVIKDIPDKMLRHSAKETASTTARPSEPPVADGALERQRKIVRDRLRAARCG